MKIEEKEMLLHKNDKLLNTGCPNFVLVENP